MNVKELIELIRKRPGMFAGNICLEDIAQFIRGFLFSNLMAERIDEIDIIFKEHFHEWVRRELETEWNIFFDEERGFTYYINNSFESEKRLDVFFDLCDKFFIQKCNKKEK